MISWSDSDHASAADIIDHARKIWELVNEMGCVIRSTSLSEKEIDELVLVIGKAYLSIHEGIERPIFQAFPDLDYVAAYEDDKDLPLRDTRKD